MEEKTREVNVLLGNPKKAILAMSIPLMVAMLVGSANNLIDAAWVSGLGPNALAAVGFVFPLFFIMMGVGNGIGIGASSCIARFIGMGDKKSADRSVTQAILLTVIGSIMLMVVLFVIQGPIFVAMGGGDILDLCLQYSTPIILFSPLLVLNFVLSNILRAEGAAKRSMYSQVLATVINIILDPIFIYDFGLGLGLTGAALATCVGMTVSLLLQVYWIFIKKDTYLKPSFKKVKLEKDIDREILRVGIPASLEMVFMSLFAIMMTVIITLVGGIDGVAVYSSTWRIIQMLMIPLMAVAGAIVPVCAAAYGSKQYDKIKVAYMFSLKFCTIIMVTLSIITLLMADYMVLAFTYSESTAALSEDLILCLRIFCIFLPFLGWGFVASGFFQSLGMGMKSLISSLIRNGMMIPLCYALAVLVGTSMSVYYGIVITEILGSIIIGTWSLLIIRVLMKDFKMFNDLEIKDEQQKS